MLLFCEPCACRLSNLVVSTQFILEALATTLLLYNARVEAVAGFLMTAATLLLTAVLLPVIQKGYDSLFVTIVVNCCRRRFDPVNAATAACMVLAGLPALFKKLLGFETSSGGATGISVSSKLAGTMKSTVTEMQKLRRGVQRRVSLAGTRAVGRRRISVVIGKKKTGKEEEGDGGEDVGDDGGGAGGDD